MKGSPMSEKPAIDRLTFKLPDDIPPVINKNIAFSYSKPVTIGKTHDPVNHPSHYISKSGLEVVDVIKAFTEGLSGYKAVAEGNIIKYILRWPKKNGIEDLKKARWYLDDLISYLENGEDA